MFPEGSRKRSGHDDELKGTTMNSREVARRNVRLAVQAHMASRGWNKVQLQQAASIDANTAGDFLNGERWPQARTLSRIELALEWPPGTIAAALEGEPLPTVSSEQESAPDESTDTLLYQRPPGLSDDAWEAIKREGLDFIEFTIGRVSRER